MDEKPEEELTEEEERAIYVEYVRKRKHLLHRQSYKPRDLTPDEKRAAIQLLAVRQKLNITQSTMATLLGCSFQTLKFWEVAARRIPYPKIMEYALRYIMNTYAVKKPLESLLDKIKEEQKNEVPTLPTKYSTRKSQAGAEREGSDPAE